LGLTPLLMGASSNRAIRVAPAREYNFGLRRRSIAADAETLITNMASPRCLMQIALPLVTPNILRRIEASKVFPDNFVCLVALNLLCACVPRHDIPGRIEQVDGVLFHAIHQYVELFRCLMQR